MIESDSEELEVAIWYDANEYVDPIKSCSGSIKDMIDIMCAGTKDTHGDIDYKILKPGDDRVPIVPRWLEKVNGAMPRLLVATTKTRLMSSVSNVNQELPNIVGDLDKKDLTRLRYITRKAHRKSRPHDSPLTDPECDQIIDKLGIEIVMDQLKYSVVH